MSYFSDLLKACMNKNGMGTAELARACGLDRTQIHRYANGTRTPVDIEAVKQVLSGLRLSVKEKIELYHCYYRTVWGNYTYESSGLIFDILTQINEIADAFDIRKITDADPFYLKNSEAITEQEETATFVRELAGRSMVLNYIDKFFMGLQVKEDAQLKLILQPNNPHIKSKLRSFFNNCENLKVEQIFCMEKKLEDEKLHNLQILNAAIPLFLSHVDYQAYYYYNELDEHLNAMSIMPNVLIGKKAVLVFDYEMESGMIFQQMEIVDWYEHIFKRMKENCSEFAKKWESTNDFMQSVDDLNQNGTVDYQVYTTPCLGNCLSRDIFETYFYEEIPNRSEIIEGLCTIIGVWEGNEFSGKHKMKENSYYSFFKKEGLIQFLETGRVLECPSELYAPLPLKVCIEMVQRMLRLMEDGFMEYRLLKERFVLSDKLIIDAYENLDKVSFIVADDQNRMEINVYEGGIVQSFRLFKKVLLEGELTYSREETVAWIKEIIQQYQQKQKDDK